MEIFHKSDFKPLRAKKIFTLINCIMILVGVLSGLILLLAPQNKTALWHGWSFLFLSKIQIQNIHMSASIISISLILILLFINKEIIIKFIREFTHRPYFTIKEILVSFLLVSIIIMGTVVNLPPFSFFVKINNQINKYWGRTISPPPYPQAELSKFEEFTDKINIPFDKAIKILKNNGIGKIIPGENLLMMSKRYNISPSSIYKILEDGGSLNKYNLTITEFGKKYRGNLKHIFSFLKKRKISFTENMTLKEIAEENNMRPDDLCTILDFFSKR